jgi:CRISPR-associated protein Cas1
VKRHLNTLYVTTQGAYLNKDGANVVVSIEGAERARVPIHTLGGLVGFGRVTLSPPLLGFCAEEGVTVSFLSEHGKFLARLEGPVSGNVLCVVSSTVGPTTRMAAPQSSGTW